MTLIWIYLLIGSITSMKFFRELSMTTYEQLEENINKETLLSLGEAENQLGTQGFKIFLFVVITLLWIKIWYDVVFK